MPSIGVSLFTIAVGAILRYAVSDSFESVSLPTVGLILMIVGIIGLVIALVMYFAPDRSTRGGSGGDRDRYVDPRY
jgi:hypothetical protein